MTPMEGEEEGRALPVGCVSRQFLLALFRLAQCASFARPQTPANLLVPRDGRRAVAVERFLGRRHGGAWPRDGNGGRRVGVSRKRRCRTETRGGEAKDLAASRW